MGYNDIIKGIFNKIKGLIGKKSGDIEPKEILNRLILELEKRKKLGIEDNAFVPNVYVIYLSPFDYEEMSPLLSGLKDQLKNRLMERVKKRGYKILSSAMNIDIREDAALMKNQVIVESSFLKEKMPIPLSEKNEAREQVFALSPTFGTSKPDEDVIHNKDFGGGVKQKTIQTKIIEEKKTKVIDAEKMKLEVIEGEEKGDCILLKEGEYTLGRGRDATILIKDRDETVSRTHFKLVVRGGLVKIKDLNSSNGTKVNGIGIEETELKKGDTIAAGKVLLRVA